MVRLQYAATHFILLTVLLTTITNLVSARRRLNRRQNQLDAPAIAKSGWTVPLKGAETCTDSQHCTDSLLRPPTDSTLQYLAIGRGTIIYTCDGRSDVQVPLYVTQQAFLYDAAALIPRFSSEEQFHSYIPRFLDYDYTSLDNSSLTCIGNVQRLDGLTIFDIYGIDAYSVKVEETVISPDNTPFDMSWAHSRNNDQEWDIYRVETAGGGPPYNCGDQIISDEIPVEYAAEYWFYRRNVRAQQAFAKM